MNPLRPDPQPAYVLLAIILTIFAVMSYRRGFSVASGVLATVAVILIVRFARGVIVPSCISAPNTSSR